MTYTRLVPVFILIVAIGSLSLAMTAQFVFGLEPCILCLYQRVPFALTGVLAVLALRLSKDSPSIPLIIIVSGLIYLIGAFIAFYHVGVEQQWWISGCSGSIAEEVSLSDLRASLMQKPEKACDDVDWTFLGISMATYNVFFSSLLGLAMTAVGFQLSKTRNRDEVNG